MSTSKVNQEFIEFFAFYLLKIDFCYVLKISFNAHLPSTLKFICTRLVRLKFLSVLD
jgi:hypothetical protein